MTEEKLPIASGRDTARGLLAALGRRRGLTIMALVTLCAGVGAALVAPWIIGLMVDDITRGGGSLLPYGLALVGSLTVGAALTWAGRVLLARLGQGTIREVREAAFRTALAQPTARIEAAGTGDLVARLSGDVRAVGQVVEEALPAFLAALFGIVLSLAGMGLLDGRFALAALLAAPVQYFSLRWFLRRSAPVYRRHRAVVAERGQRTIEAVRGVDTVLALRTEEQHLERIAEASEQAIGLEVRATKVRNDFNVFLNGAELVGLSAVLVVGYFLVADGQVGLGAATAAALYFLGLFGPMGTLLFRIDELQDAGASLARLFGVIGLPKPAPREGVAAPRRGAIDVQDLGFAHRPGQRDLDAVSMSAEPGEKIAVVGASGAGKTTLARVLAGALPHGEGAVRHDEVDIEAWHPHDLRDAVVMLTQEPHVFAGSIRDDLALFSDADEEEMRREIDQLGAGWILALPDGLDTVVGEAGLPLTPGQTQHLALVRVALAAASVVILDEATAEAGSADAELLDQAALAAIGGRTGIVIAHRLSQAVTADRILVMQDGRVVQSGTHDELVAAAGPYAELWAAWTAW
ncbi:ABC transporter ATP-binding protein [Microbacterium luteolum]|uniref:ABC transporter ATP-binding protein/permease n=1 Tax=Microbacterium luteolum TaxID=69367 RepID=A0ABY7XJI8_MICLT|nr:ABC transporter ATP-binding protein [Microbacterium luteolum]WDM42250.1 ABC transporter ATP-binding protein/permease [Microbacterium luteolum]